MPVQYAGMIIRIIASIVDTIIMLVMIIVPAVIVLLLAGAGTNDDISSLGGVIIVLVIIGTAITWLYNAGFESSRYMATPGKMVCGIRVTDLQGKRITFVRATIRYVFKSVVTVIIRNFVNQCIATNYTILDVLLILTTSKKQSLHDMLAGTVVVTRDSVNEERGNP